MCLALSFGYICRCLRVFAGVDDGLAQCMGLQLSTSANTLIKIFKQVTN